MSYIKIKIYKNIKNTISNTYINIKYNFYIIYNLTLQ